MYIAFFRTMPSGLTHVLNYANDNSMDYFRDEKEVIHAFRDKELKQPALMGFADKLFMIKIDSNHEPCNKPIEVDID